MKVAVEMPTASPGVRRSWPGWLAALVLNSQLGYVAVVPFLFLWVLVSTELGWETPDPTENDGMLVMLLVSVVPSVLLLVLFGAANYALTRLFDIRSRWFWTAAVLLLVLPTVVALAWPASWSAIRWY
jgi:lysylphosphatidylglycerol synthetase-like protein (DUF2156 family)